MDTNQQIPNEGTSAGPSWAAGDGKVWIAWKGQGSDTKIYVGQTTSIAPNPSTSQYVFQSIQPAGTVGTSTGPAIAYCNKTVHLVWKGQSDGGIFWATSPDGQTWTIHGALTSPTGPAPGTSATPALVSDGSSVFMAWKGESDNSIWWSKCSDGKTWTQQQSLSSQKGQAPGTSDGPTLASNGRAVYMAWKGKSDGRIWWSKCSDGKTWTQQQTGPSGASAGPALAVDGNGVVWVAWNGPQTAQYNHVFFDTPGFQVYFSSLTDESKNQWSRPASRFGVATTQRPTLVSTGNDSTTLMMAWSSLASPPPGDPHVFSLYYGTLRLPAQTYDFLFPSFDIRNMRSGTIFGKTSSDTDYASVSIKIMGQTPLVQTQFMGDQTGGTVSTTLGYKNVKVQDTDTVAFHYSIINRGGAESSANLSFLVNAATTFLNDVEKADLAALSDSTGLPLTSLPTSAAGALVGAQIGTDIVPIFGTILGAVVGWLVSIAPWGSLWPNCDGPVAAGLHLYDAATIRAVAGTHPFANADDNPGVNSQGGCDSNSDYVVNWTIQPSAGS